MIDISIATPENIQAEALRFYRTECRKGKFADINFNVIINTTNNTISFKRTIGKNRTSCKVYQLKAFNHIFDIHEAMIIYRDEQNNIKDTNTIQLDGFII